LSGSRAGKVPPHHVWLQGDNTHNSNDSRAYGPVPEALIHGRVFFRVWPPSSFGRENACARNQALTPLTRRPIRPDPSMAMVSSSELH